MQAEAGRREAVAGRRAEDARREIACSMTNVMLRLVRRTGGDAAVAELLDRAGIEHEPSYLENVENWISLDRQRRCSRRESR
jgi:hypothetical protein